MKHPVLQLLKRTTPEIVLESRQRLVFSAGLRTTPRRTLAFGGPLQLISFVRDPAGASCDFQRYTWQGLLGACKTMRAVEMLDAKLFPAWPAVTPDYELAGKQI